MTLMSSLFVSLDRRYHELTIYVCWNNINMLRGALSKKVASRYEYMREEL